MLPITAILQARMSSTRLPGKVLKPVLGRPMIERHIERIHRAPSISRLVVATSTDPSDDVIEAFCKEQGVDIFRGDLFDVLDRYYHCAKAFKAEHVMRLTADCPLADPDIMELLANHYAASGKEYSSSVMPNRVPKGLDAELFTFASLERAWKESSKPYDREHVTPYIKSTGLFSIAPFPIIGEDLSPMRWTVDYPQDLDFVRAVYGELYEGKPDFRMKDILALVKERPELTELNANLV